jgi:hypothetical protein
MRGFPPWLDPETLAWAAKYCEAMALRLPAGLEAATAADGDQLTLSRGIAAAADAGLRGVMLQTAEAGWVARHAGVDLLAQVETGSA